MLKKILIGLGIVFVILFVKFCFFTTEFCGQVEIKQTVVSVNSNGAILNTEAWVETGKKREIVYWSSIKIDKNNISKIRLREIERAEKKMTEQSCK